MTATLTLAALENVAEERNSIKPRETLTMAYETEQVENAVGKGEESERAARVYRDIDGLRQQRWA
jgi:hypothetical protein